MKTLCISGQNFLTVRLNFSSFILLGGRVSGSNSEKVYHYDWDAPQNGWTTLQDMPGKRFRPGCGAVKYPDESLKVISIGGSTTTEFGGAQRHVWRYDVASDSWSVGSFYLANTVRLSVCLSDVCCMFAL